MPRNSGGQYSLPTPGNPVVTGSTITSTWANETLSDIAAELTNSMARGFGSAAMEAPLLLDNGTANDPALAFASETNTGLYLAGASDMRMVVNATTALAVTPASVSFPLGLVATQDTPDGSAVVGTANGTGYGGDFNAATSTGAGVRGTGVGSGTGGTFTGGTTGPGVTGSGGATSGVGVLGAGTGPSAGVSGTGGPTNGAGVSGAGTGTGSGVSGTGGATGAGIRGIGGATSGSGGVFTGTAGNADGVTTTGQGTGSGLVGTGGGTNGTGAVFTGGGSSGNGLFGIGVGNGVGGKFFNAASSTGPALEAIGASTAAAASFDNSGGGVSLLVGSGHVKFAGANPGKFTAYTNTQTPSNLVKVWGQITTDGAGNVTVVDGFNIASVAITASHIIVTFASAMSTATYATVVSPLTTGVPIPVSAYVNSQTTALARFACWKNQSTDRVAPVNFTSDAIGICFMVMGLQ